VKVGENLWVYFGSSPYQSFLFFSQKCIGFGLRPVLWGLWCEPDQGIYALKRKESKAMWIFEASTVSQRQLQNQLI
jgi:hypothetical protein